MAYDNPSPENRFKPGESGNPNGRPKGSISLVGILREKLAECPEGTDKKTYAQLLIQRALNIALQGGDVSMIRDIFDRIDGKPTGSLDLTSLGKQIESGVTPAQQAILQKYEDEMKKSLT
jgi:hypothetical protein